MVKSSAPPWSANSNLPHRSGEGCDLSITERQKASRDILSRKLSQLNGPNFLGVNLLLVVRDAVFWDVSREFLRFCQRADPLVVVKLLRGRVLLRLQEHQLCIEQEAAHSSGRSPMAHLIVRMSRSPEPAPPLANSCAGDSGVQMFLPIASRTGALIGDSLTWCSEAMPVFVALRAIFYLPPSRAICAAPALRTGGMSELRGMRAVVQFLRQSAEPCAAPPTSPFTALLVEARAIKAEARFPRCFFFFLDNVHMRSMMSKSQEKHSRWN